MAANGVEKATMKKIMQVQEKGMIFSTRGINPILKLKIFVKLYFQMPRTYITKCLEYICQTLFSNAWNIYHQMLGTYLSNSIFKFLEHIFMCGCFISIEKMHQSISQNLISDFFKGFETNFANCVVFMFINIFS